VDVTKGKSKRVGRGKLACLLTLLTVLLCTVTFAQNEPDYDPFDDFYSQPAPPPATKPQSAPAQKSPMAPQLVPAPRSTVIQSAPVPVQQTAHATQPAQSSNPYFTGTGGKGIRLAVLEPTGKGLSADEQWVLSHIQGATAANFNKFSAMTIVERQHVEKIMADVAKAMQSGYYSDETMVKIGHAANASHVLTGLVTKTANAITLELVVTNAQTLEREASYHKSTSLLALENSSAINDAAADLLRQLGVSLTSAGLAELKKTADMNKIQAENWLARGITAERQGTQVTAQSYYFLAAALDPSLLEAATRSSTISANISSGNIGADIRNDIAWRDNWVAWLTEFENLFYETVNNATPPYTLFYSTGIQQGNVNYQKRTVDLSISTNLRGNGAWINSIAQAANRLYTELNTGLDATGRRNVWGLGNWPQQGVTNTSPFASYKQKQYDLSIAFELVNEQNRVIGKQTLRLKPSFSLDRSYNDGKRFVAMNHFNTVVFKSVNPNDMSTNLTIRIASVNETPPQNARFPITAVSESKWKEYISNNNFNHLRVENGVVLGFNSSLSDKQRLQFQNLVIPADIWGEPITSIEDNAFSGNQLTNITIPNSVTSIGNHVFSNNKLIDVTIPNSVTSIGTAAFFYNNLNGDVIPYGVTSIGDYAFSDNRFTDITIPYSVTSIGIDAFSNNRHYSITSITIGNNVSLSGNIVSNGNFAETYNVKGTKGGTYYYCDDCGTEQWFDDLSQLQMIVKEVGDEQKAKEEKDSLKWFAKKEKDKVEREENQWKLIRKPKIGISLGMGGMWSDSSLHKAFGLEMNNLNGSTFESWAAIFDLGLAFIVPFSRNIAFVGEANYLFDRNSSYYKVVKTVELQGFNFPVLLQISTKGIGPYFEAGGQTNILFANNQNNEKSTIFDYGLVASVGVSPVDGGGLHLRFSLNGKGYYTWMIMCRYFWGTKGVDIGNSKQ
jgi:hypothetical protein